MTHASQAEGICRLCGEPTVAATGGSMFERFTMLDRPSIEQAVCMSHGDEFLGWVNACRNRQRMRPEYEAPVSTDDFCRWLSSVLRRLAKLEVAGIGVHRCEAIGNGKWGGIAGERCSRFAKRKWNEHFVCGHHGAHLDRTKKGDEPLYTFDPITLDTTRRLGAMVRELLA